jgi:hypothetical protein
MTSKLSALFLATTFVLLTCAAPVAAADGPLLATAYWDSFLEHWQEALQRQNGVILAVLFLGGVCLFIITRGKWRK